MSRGAPLTITNRQEDTEKAKRKPEFKTPADRLQLPVLRAFAAD